MTVNFHKFHSYSPECTFELGQRLGQQLRGGEVIVLSGGLGSGKTCFAQGVGDGLGVDQPLVSPTFPLLLHYRGRSPLAHFDLYRLNGLEEFILLDGETLIHDPQLVCLIEWGERITTLLPDGCTYVHFKQQEEGREIVVRGLKWA